MKKALLIGTGAVAILAVGVAVLPTFVPSSVYQDTIETQLSRALDREVRVTGDVGLRVFPTIEARTGRVEIDNPTSDMGGFTAPHFATVEGLDARVKLLPLLSRRVEIKSFQLDGPDINLERLADGRTNWAFGDSAPARQDNGPFKRDGRYADLDPSIGRFTLSGGRITYADRVAGTEYRVEDINVDFVLNGLAAPLSIDGDFTYDDVPTELDLSVRSVRAVLDGQASDVAVDMTTPFAQIDADGEILPGEDIAFDLDVNGNVSDMAELTRRAPTDIPYSDLIQTAQLSGNYVYQNGVLRANGADITAAGSAFNAAFAGDAALTESPTATGEVRVNARDLQALAQAFDLDVTGLDRIETLDLTADLATQDEGLRAENVVAAIAGPDLTGNFAGTVDYGEAIRARGVFDADVAAIPAFIDALALELPQARAVDRLAVSGTVDYSESATKLSELDVTTEGPVAARYSGTATLGETVGFSGDFTTALSDLAALSTRTGIDIPYSEAIGTIDIAGSISGQGDSLSISGLTASLTDGLLNGEYQGAVALNDGVSLDGRLSADITSLRALAGLTGTQLPPSTDTGAIYERFAVSGDVEGTPNAITFTKADIAFDDMAAKGDLSVDLTRERPFVTADLAAGPVDFAPYMAAYSTQNAAGGIQGWSEEPLNLAALNAVDGDFALSTPSITTGRIALGQSNIDAKLRGGVLTATLPNMALYGGSGRMNAKLDASGAVPAFALDASLDAMQATGFLGAVAGFTNASGTMGSVLDIQGRGRSQAEIMRSLGGRGDAKLANGAIAGVDVRTLAQNLDQALTTRSLPAGIGPDQITRFRNMGGAFTIRDGVAAIDDFTFRGPGVAADGGGTLDIGRQSVDFGLRPRLTGEDANGLAAFGVPIRARGTFGSISVGLDSEELTKIAANRAKREAQTLIQDQIGGDVGSVLGGLLGGSDTPQTAPNPSGDGTPETDKTEPEDVVKDVLGGLFGD